MTTPKETTGTVKFNTEYAPEDKAKLGKNPFLGKTVTTTDVKTSAIDDEWERVNDKNIATDYVNPINPPANEEPEELEEPGE